MVIIETEAQSIFNVDSTQRVYLEYFVTITLIDADIIYHYFKTNMWHFKAY